MAVFWFFLSLKQHTVILLSWLSYETADQSTRSILGLSGKRVFPSPPERSEKLRLVPGGQKKILRCIPSIFKIIIKEEPVFFALKLKTLSKIYIKIEVTVFLEEQALPCLWKLEVCNWHRKKKQTKKTKPNPQKTTKNSNSYMYKPRKSYDIENCKILSKLFTTI